MGSKKDIGRIFRERFKEFEQTPDAKVWDTIASELDQGAQRFIPPFWLYTGGALIIILIAGLIYLNPWNSESNAIDQPIEITQQNTTKENQNNNQKENSSTTTNTTSEIDPQDIPNQQASTEVIKDSLGTSNTTESDNMATGSITDANRDNTSLNNTSNKSSKAGQPSATNNYSISSASQNFSSTASAPGLFKVSSSYLAQAKERQEKEAAARKKYLEKIERERSSYTENNTSTDSDTALTENQSNSNTENEKDNEDKEAPKKDKSKTDAERKIDREEATQYEWAVTPYSSLIRYGSLTKASSIDDRLENNPREAINTLGYGVKIESRLNERSSIRFGIGVAPLKYQTDNFQVFENNGIINIFQLSGIDPSSVQQGSTPTTPEALAFFRENTVVTIEQDLSYVEIPLDYQYHFLNKRVGLSISPGLSMFILTKNDIYAISDTGESFRVGNESNLTNLSLAFNLSVGAHYNFNKYWRANVEPVFRYQLNPYTNSISNFRPYYIGAQFGITYKF